jgi:hypothetical protein
MPVHFEDAFGIQRVPLCCSARPYAGMAYKDPAGEIVAPVHAAGSSPRCYREAGSSRLDRQVPGHYHASAACFSRLRDASRGLEPAGVVRSFQLLWEYGTNPGVVMRGCKEPRGCSTAPCLSRPSPGDFGRALADGGAPGRHPLICPIFARLAASNLHLVSYRQEEQSSQTGTLRKRFFLGLHPKTPIRIKLATWQGVWGPQAPKNVLFLVRFRWLCHRNRTKNSRVWGAPPSRNP